MIDITTLEKKIIDDGYNEELAEAKLCQDKAYLEKINSSNKNWVNVDNQTVFSKILSFIKNLYN